LGVDAVNEIAGDGEHDRVPYGPTDTSNAPCLVRTSFLFYSQHVQKKGSSTLADHF
jgi:hypothetical protein